MFETSLNTWSQKDVGPVAGLPKGLPLDFGPGRKLKAFMGWNGVMVMNPSVNLVDMAREYMLRAKNESCGQCFPCRLGTAKMHAILERICEGRGTLADLDTLEFLARQVRDASRCDIGQTSPRPILDALKYGRESFVQAVTQGQPIPRGTYVAKVTAPCINACPSHVDIPGYLEQIRFGSPEGCLDVVRRDCSLPGVIGRVCVRPCESNCRRSLVDESLAIRALKRFAADQELKTGHQPFEMKAEPKPDKVAIIGAGPAGLACAYYLGLNGYTSTIFEKLTEPGGMAAVGIPDYRLPRKIMRGEAEQLEALGVEFKYGVNVGTDLSMEEITAQGFKAVFVGIGAHAASAMRCEGEDAGYACFMTGIEFLKEVADGNRPLEGNKILVIGGGNVAMDCVRSALRLGFTDVNLLYRRTEAEMPADPVEIEEAQEEGVNFHYLVAPIRILAENGKVTGLECRRMELGPPDASGRRSPVPIPGSEFIIETDAIVPAVGQTCVVDCVLPDGPLTRWKTLVVDEKTFQAEDPTLFGGGDCVTGPSTLIGAIAAGKKAAGFIAQYLETGACVPRDEDYLEDLISRIGVFEPKESKPFSGTLSKLVPNVEEPEERIKSFEEYEAGVSPADAVNEAARCLRCYRIGLAAV